MAKRPRTIIVRMMKEYAERIHIVKTDKSVIELTECTLYRATNFIELHTKDKLIIIPMEEIHSIQCIYEV